AQRAPEPVAPIRIQFPEFPSRALILSRTLIAPSRSPALVRRVISAFRLTRSSFFACSTAAPYFFSAAVTASSRTAGAGATGGGGALVVGAAGGGGGGGVFVGGGRPGRGGFSAAPEYGGPALYVGAGQVAVCAVVSIAAPARAGGDAGSGFGMAGLLEMRELNQVAAVFIHHHEFGLDAQYFRRIRVGPVRRGAHEDDLLSVRRKDTVFVPDRWRLG